MKDAVESVSNLPASTIFKENTGDAVQCGAEGSLHLGGLSQNCSVAVKGDINNFGIVGAERSSRSPKISKDPSKQQGMISVAGRGVSVDGRPFVLDGQWPNESLDPRGQVGQWLPWSSGHKLEAPAFGGDGSQRASERRPAGVKRQRADNSAFPYPPSFCTFVPPYSAMPMQPSSSQKNMSEQSESTKSNQIPSNASSVSAKETYYGEFHLQACDGETKVPESTTATGSLAVPNTSAAQQYRSSGNNLAQAPRFKVRTVALRMHTTLQHNISEGNLKNEHCSQFLNSQFLNL